MYKVISHCQDKNENIICYCGRPGELYVLRDTLYVSKRCVIRPGKVISFTLYVVRFSKRCVIRPDVKRTTYHLEL